MPRLIGPTLRVGMAAALASAFVVAHAAAQGETDPLPPLKPSLDGELPETAIPPSGAASDRPEQSEPAAPAPGSGSAGGAGTIVDPAAEPGAPGTPLPGDPANAAGAPDEEASGGADSGIREPPDGSAAKPEAPRPLRFGLIAGRDLRATMARIEPVADDLTRILGRPVELLPMSSYRAMVDAQTQQRIDGGFYSASAYALAESECRCLEPLVAPAAYDGTTRFHAVIVAPPDSGISSAANLEGKVVAVGAPDSIGNRRMQLAGLLAEGIDPARFAGLREVDSGAEAIRQMLSGAVDAAFIWSSLAGDQESGYSRGTLAELVADGEIEMGDIAIVWRSPAIPHGPVAVLKALPDSDKDRIETYLVGLATENPPAYDALNPFFSGGYEFVEPADYEALNLLANEAIDALSPRSGEFGEAAAEPPETGREAPAYRR